MGDRATGTGAAFDHAAAVMATMVATGGYASAVAAVSDGAATRWSHAVGGGTAAVAPDTIFPLASLTKPLLAVAVMQLVERGLLLLGDPVAAYLPEFGANGKGGVTVWHLLTHSSGLAEFDDVAPQMLDGAYIRREPRAALYAIACGLGLEHPPGARQRYSRLPWLVLGELIARVGGRDYPEWLRDELFTPLGMRDTGFTPADVARVAREPAALPELDTPEAWAYRDSLATDLYSTVPDLLALGRALLGSGPGGTARVLGAGTSRGEEAAYTTPGGLGNALNWRGRCMSGRWGAGHTSSWSNRRASMRPHRAFVTYTSWQLPHSSACSRRPSPVCIMALRPMVMHRHVWPCLHSWRSSTRRTAHSHQQR